jgi:serine/threonine-protein kinase
VLGTVPPVPPTGPTPVEEDERRSRWPIVLLVLGLVAAIVLIAVLVATAGDDDEPTTTEPTTSAPTTSAPTTEDTPTEETTSAPAEVQIDEDDYLGRPVDDVVAELRDLGLRVETQPVDNPGDEEADTVAAVRPTGTLAEGDTVTVEYYREAEPTEEPSDTGTPTPSDTASPSAPATSGEPSPTASQASGSPSPSAAGSPSAASAPASGRVGSR